MMLNALLLLVMLFAMPAHALTVTVDAPEELEALLTQHLEAARAARRGETLDEVELLRLRELGVETARELLATEGYFSPQIESSLVQTEGDWVMHYAVTPGPLTRVRMLKIGFEGGL